MSYGAKVITAGVAAKAVLMGTLVSILAVAGFVQSLILVLVSACATGVFGILIVLIQTHAEKGMHERIDRIEARGERLEEVAADVQAKSTAIAETVSNGDEVKP